MVFVSFGAGCAKGGTAPLGSDGSTPPIDAATSDSATNDGATHDGAMNDGAVNDGATPDGGGCTTASDCDDGDACNGTESCTAGRCAPGTAVSCDDFISCTADTCNASDGACSHTPDDSVCSDGLMCDPTDGCIPRPPCLADADCDDGAMCNGVETCDPAIGCLLGTAPSCDDGFACTSDSCDAATDACVHTPSASSCDDGLVCDGVEACDPSAPGANAAGCVTSAPPVCNDGIACTVDSCSEAAGGCTTSLSDSACDDGRFCNGVEHCTATGCAAGTPPSCDDGIGCTTGRCDAPSDVCVQTGSDAFCTDSVACNGVERCDASGATSGTGCVAGTPVNCNDGVACTVDSCTGSGTCVHVGTDADGDGYIAAGCGAGNDCNDSAAAVHPGATEVCDGLDNNCSGVVDDGPTMQCALGSAPRACTTSCGSAGTRACNAACALGSCYGSEVCNGCDDDGVGGPDNGFLCVQGTTTSCTTACGTAGTHACTASCSGYTTCAAPSEICGNGCDDNANGVTDEGCGPSNDTCGGAIALRMTGMGTTVSGTTVGSTNQSGCGSGGDVYYSFTLTQREVVYLDTETASYDTEIAIASGCSGNIWCDDDSCFGTRSQLVQVLNPGTYYAVVSGFGGTTGTFTLRFQHLPTGNGTPIVLSHPATGGTRTGTTSGTGTLAETCTSASGPEQMYYFTTCSYTGGAFSASTCTGTSYDTVLQFRDATSGTNTCNDDSCGLQSSISGTVSSGAGLRAVYVDGYSGAGSYTLTYTMP